MTYPTNEFTKAVLEVSKIKDITSLKKFIVQHRSDVATVKASIGYEQMEEQLSIWIDLQNSHRLRPYIVGGSDKLNAKNLEELVEGYLVKGTRTPLLKQSISNLQNAEMAMDLIVGDTFDHNFKVAYVVTLEWAQNHRALALLTKLKEILDAI